MLWASSWSARSAAVIVPAPEQAPSRMSGFMRSTYRPNRIVTMCGVKEQIRPTMTRLTPVIMVTALHAVENRIEGIKAGADDFLSKPFNAEELRARVGSLLRVKRYTDDLESAEAVIVSLALTVEARDPYTDGHCKRLAEFSVALGEALHFTHEDLKVLRLGGYLHDVGKIGIPDSVLQKPGKLTEAEFEVMKGHSIIGERLCGNLRSLQAVRPILRSHHERLDGSGYPDGLRGDEVPLLAQIVSIADGYDAMTTTRPYRKSLPAEHAYRELRIEAVKKVRNPVLVESFIALAQEGRLQGVAETLETQEARLQGMAEPLETTVTFKRVS